MAINLFRKDLEIGTFKGFTESGLEFAAEIVTPYHSDEELTPRTGHLLLVELGTPEEAILGRITRFVPVGIMAGSEGEEYLSSMSRLGRDIPEQLKEDRLRYNVRVKLLGGVKTENENLKFVPAVRKLPHLGARVAYPSVDILSYLCRLGAQEAQRDTIIGHYALGEVIYNGNEEAGQDYFVTMSDTIPVHFDINNLVGKRTFVFARAGYGKSNLMKFLIAELYREEPRIKFRSNEKPVGTVIFDPEGEYFWPDENGRPGLCDVEHLRQRIAVFTNRVAPNPYYGSWKVGDVRIDLRRCSPGEIVSQCISEERQEHQNVRKMRMISRENWSALIDSLYENTYNVDDQEIRRLTGINNLSDVECSAMRSNLIPIIHALHDPNSNLLDATLRLLRAGRIVVIDISLISGRVGLQIAGLLLNSIFYNNQESFTDPNRGRLIPTVAVLEEAQSVLGKSAKEDSPFVQWTKEGRKYSLGAMLVTQQPGSIAPELLSQGDNFFSFHLLSAHDLKTLQFHNAHFSDDVLGHLLNEPISGNTYFWASPYQPFVLPARILNFEKVYGQCSSEIGEHSQAVDAGLQELLNRERRMISKLAPQAKELVENGTVAVESIESDNNTWAIYKPKMSVEIAKRMSDDERDEYCSGGSDNKTFVSDEVLDRIVAIGLSEGNVDRVQGRRNRDNKEGVFYRFPRSNVNCDGNSINGITLLHR